MTSRRPNVDTTMSHLEEGGSQSAIKANSSDEDIGKNIVMKDIDDKKNDNSYARYFKFIICFVGLQVSYVS